MSGSAAAVLTKPAFRKIEWLERDIAVERRPDGVIVLKSRIPLRPYEKHIPALLAKWARETPNRVSDFCACSWTPLLSTPSKV